MQPLQADMGLLASAAAELNLKLANNWIAQRAFAAPSGSATGGQQTCGERKVEVSHK